MFPTKIYIYREAKPAGKRFPVECSACLRLWNVSDLNYKIPQYSTIHLSAEFRMRRLRNLNAIRGISQINAGDVRYRNSTTD